MNTSGTANTSGVAENTRGTVNTSGVAENTRGTVNTEGTAITEGKGVQKGSHEEKVAQVYMEP